MSITPLNLLILTIALFIVTALIMTAFLTIVHTRRSVLEAVESVRKNKPSSIKNTERCLLLDMRLQEKNTWAALVLLFGMAIFSALAHTETLKVVAYSCFVVSTIYLIRTLILESVCSLYYYKLLRYFPSK